MKIFLLLSILTIVFLFIGKSVFYSAKRNLFKVHTEWSSKDIKINYSKRRETSGSKKGDNYLKIIAEESRVYLEDQSKREKE